MWRDTTSLWPGEDWRAKIRQAITCDALVFIVCFSHSSLARETSYQNEELLLAIEQMRSRPPEVPWLIPVRLSDCDIPDRDVGGGRTLSSIHRADIFGGHLLSGTRLVVDAVLHMLGRRSQVGSPGARLPEDPAGAIRRKAAREYRDTSARSRMNAPSAPVEPRWESHSGRDGHVGREWEPTDLARAEAYYRSLAGRARFVHD